MKSLPSYHRFLTLVSCFITFASGATLSAQQWRHMDCGPYFSASFRLPNGQVTPKGIAIKAEGNAPGGMLFDADLLRMTALWRGPLVKFSGREDFRFENRHELGAPPQITTKAHFGWSRSATFSDPRSRPVGVVDPQQGRYLGLHVNGKTTTLHYQVFNVDVLESATTTAVQGGVVLTRHMQVAAHGEPMFCLLADSTGPWLLKNSRLAIARHGGRTIAVSAGTLRTEGNRLCLEMSPSEAASQYAIHILPYSSFPTLNLNGIQFPFATKTQPGTARWLPVQVTQGKLGQDTQKPYVVDTLTLPASNPWNALLYLSGHDFFSNGDAAVCTGHGDVWLVRGVSDDLRELKWKRFATGLLNPLGLKIVDDVVYVTCHDQITRLHDRNGDDEADYYENFNNGWQVDGTHHRFATGLEVDSQGNFFHCRCTNEGRIEHGGTVVRVAKDGRNFDIYATGLRNPNGMGIGPNDLLTFSDQQGGWIPSSPIHVIRQGQFYGYMPSHHRAQAPTDFAKPLCWIPHSIDNSSGGQAWTLDDRWGLPRHQLIHLSYGKCTLFVVPHEEVDGVFQGGVVPIPVNFTSGAMRARFRPQDGQLYVTGLRGWQTSAAKNGCFQRVRYTGQTVRLPINTRVTQTGIWLTFSCKLDPQSVDADSFAVEQWNYRWTKNYGSPDYSVLQPNRRGRDEVDVYDAILSQDGRSVWIELDEVQPVMQMSIEYSLKAEDGTRFSSTLYNTIHVCDADDPN